MKHFQHKKTKEIVTYEDGVLRTNQFCIELGVEPSAEFWEELKDKYPPGTKVKDTYEGTFGLIYEKLSTGLWKIGEMSTISIPEHMIGDGKRFRLAEKPKLYPLKDCDLVNGKYYTTYYPGQGLYTFKCGYNLWVSHSSKDIYKLNSGNFTPSNGFDEFREATPEEIKMLGYGFTTSDGVDIGDFKFRKL